MFRKRVIFLVFSSFLWNCAGKPCGRESDQKLFLEELYKGYLYSEGVGGRDGEQTSVLNNPQQWEGFMDTIASVQQHSKFLEGKSLDFSKYTVIAVVDKNRNTGGYSVVIDGVYLVKNQFLECHYRVLTPSPTQLVTMILNRPIHMVRIPKTDKKILFKRK